MMIISWERILQAGLVVCDLAIFGVAMSRTWSPELTKHSMRVNRFWAGGVGDGITQQPL